MKKNIIIFLFFILSASTLLAQTNDWYKVKDLEKAFSIDFPSEPKASSQDVPTEQGTVKMHMYTLQTLDDDNFIYMSIYTKYPDTFFPDGLDTEEKQNTVLDGSVKGAVESTNGKLISDEKISFNGYFGRDFKIGLDLSGPHIIRLRTFLVGYTLYASQIICSKEKDGNDRSNRFFESFELINVKQ